MTGALTRLWNLARPVLGGTGTAILVVVLILLGRLDTVEFWALSKLYDVRGAQATTAPVVIVTIDESSINEIGTFPFPRAVHATLLQKISEGRPLAIGVDVIFEGPSPRGEEDDLVLGDAVTLAGNVVLAALKTVDYQGFYEREVLSVPNPTVRQGAAAVAPVNLLVDSDGQVRRSSLTISLGGEPVTAFDVALYRLAVKAGAPAPTLPVSPTVHVNFRGGPRTYPWVPFYRVVNGEIAPSVFRDKIVLVGPTSEVLHDWFTTPFAPRGDMPGVEIHANVIDTYLTGNPLRDSPPWIGAVLAALAGIAASVAVVRLHALRGFVVTAVVWLVLAVVTIGCFALADFWLRAMGATVALVLGYGATTIERYVREQREKRRLSQFFSPDVLEHVVRAKGSLGSSRRLVTVLFSDVRGFTTMSERLQPEQVAEILQEYLTEMTEIVFRHNGTVDKYIGDCVMALYNAPFDDPEHAANAIRTGLDFQERTLAVSKKWEEKLGVTIRNGVGINTGDAVVGTMGSRQRLEYTAIGDTINLGARLESITKEYNANIIISETTYALLKPGEFVTRELGAVTVKGKTQPVKIYAVASADAQHGVGVPLDAAATLSAGDLECVARVVSVSESGLDLARLPEGWTADMLVSVRCEGEALPKPFCAEARIVWSHGDRAGLTFTHVDDDVRAMLADCVTARVR